MPELSLIYENQKFAQSLRDFATSEYNQENIDFLLEFRNIEFDEHILTNPGAKEPVKPLNRNSAPASTAEELYKKYIEPANAINIPAAMREKIMADFIIAEQAKKNGASFPEFTTDNLKIAANEISKLVYSDMFPRYLQSPMYKKFENIPEGSNREYETWRDKRVQAIENHISNLEQLRDKLTQGVDHDILGGGNPEGEQTPADRHTQENRRIKEKIDAEIIEFKERNPLPRDFSEEKLTRGERLRNWFASTALGKLIGVAPATEVAKLNSDKNFDKIAMGTTVIELKGNVDDRLEQYNRDKPVQPKVTAPEPNIPNANAPNPDALARTAFQTLTKFNTPEPPQASRPQGMTFSFSNTNQNSTNLKDTASIAPDIAALAPVPSASTPAVPARDINNDPAPDNEASTPSSATNTSDKPNSRHSI